ncbi:ferritin-like domain-containing protein [Rhodocista pekingensis]|uniref:Ferritin-like domain-containing protein n=1 Tax=Rhodocista pekingensis TaxID=201185 RepID=A0ABW2KQV8_9PROT
MPTPRDTLIDYLRDAYAMEQQALSVIDRQLERVANYPSVQQRLQQHRTETESQAERLETCLQRLGSDTSAVKTGVAKLGSNLQAMMNMFASDEIMKDMISNYAFENYEAVNYKILATTAEIAGEPEVARIANEILKEEEAMIQWLDENVPSVTRDYLARDSGAAPQAASR